MNITEVVAALPDFVVGTVQENKEKKGFFSAKITKDGKAPKITSPNIKAQFGGSEPNKERNIDKWSIPLSKQVPVKPSGSQKSWEDKFFDTMGEVQKWTFQAFKDHAKDFFGKDKVSDEFVENACYPVVKYDEDPEKRLEYGPKVQPVVNKKQDAEGFWCIVKDPSGKIIDFSEIIGRKCIVMVTFELRNLWRMKSTGKCGLKIVATSIDVVEFLDIQQDVPINRNMYDENPAFEEDLIAATQAAEEEQHKQKMRELEAQGPPPQEEDEEPSSKREREEEEEDKQPTPAKKGKGKAKK